MNIAEVIKQNRPNLSASSIKTYTSILSNLFKNIYGDIPTTIEGFNDVPVVIGYLMGLQPSRRKSILAALVVLTNNDRYRTAMLADIAAHKTEIAKQTISPAQEANWIEPNEITEVYNKLTLVWNNLSKRKELTANDLQSLQDYVIVCLLSGINIPPRRSLDYTAFKIREINKSVDNYLDKSQLVFNTYKTAKTYGQQRVTISKELKSILTKWIKINPTTYLLFDINKNPLNSVKLGQRLNRIFSSVGDKVSVNSMRHTYLTDKYSDDIARKQDQTDTMTDMGSSVHQLVVYVKLHDSVPK